MRSGGVILRTPYDRGALRPTVVHLGLGAFSRAHMLSYLDDLARAGETGVGVVGASMTSERVPMALQPQAGLYTLVEASSSGRCYREIGVLTDVLGPSRRAELIDAVAASSTTMVTTTVTEKGYGFDLATGELDPSDPAMAHDLAEPSAPLGVVGLIAAGLVKRKRASGGPVTVVCCDVLASGSRRLGRSVVEFASRLDGGAAAWIEANVSFPDSLVDRIVPATTDELRAEVAAGGFDDAWPVLAEPYRQWILQDRLTPGVPSLADAGVVMASDVEPWERMKVRVLNGLHSACAYLGLRLGHKTIDEVVSDPGAQSRLDDIEAEILAVLQPPPGEDASVYAATVRRRFGNSALGHTCRQIGRDGSAKLPQRILPTVAAALDAGTCVDALALVLAWWVGHLRRTAARDINDPRADELAALVGVNRDGASVAGALMELEHFAPPRIKHDPRWRTALAAAIDQEGAP